MRAVVQRVSRASVTVDGEPVAEIGHGLLVLLCIEAGDGEANADLFARKIARMRLFGDGEGRMNLSVLDVRGAVLSVSQFTLAADWRRGNRPSFSRAAAPEAAQALYERFCIMLEGEGVPVQRGRFAAHMDVALVNDGPVTIWMDAADP